MSGNLVNVNKNVEEKKDDKKNNKIDFAKKKENTVCSLFEVEHFLCDFKRLLNTIKLYKILK